MRPLPRDSIDDNDERGMTTDRQFKHDGLIIRWTLSAVYEGARSNVLQLGTDLAFKIPRGERLPRDDSLETRSVRDILNLGAGSIAGSSRRKVWHEVKRTSLLWHTNTFRETRHVDRNPPLDAVQRQTHPRPSTGLRFRLFSHLPPRRVPAIERRRNTRRARCRGAAASPPIPA